MNMQSGVPTSNLDKTPSQSKDQAQQKQLSSREQTIAKLRAALEDPNMSVGAKALAQEGLDNLMYMH